MLCKLYKVKYKSQAPDDTRFNEFRKFYEENGVKVIGGWQNSEDKTELYFMTGYSDQDHYEKFVSEMRENSRYQELTNQLSDERESIEVTTLNSVDDIST